MKPKCSKCGKEMEQKKKGNFKYWHCKNDCRFIHPVYPDKLQDSEKRFLDNLINNKKL